MKTKLLKKVRRRYIIYKFDKLGLDADAHQKIWYEGGTFYGLYNIEWGRFIKYGRTYHDVYTLLITEIKYRYRNYSKHYKSTLVKMWYNK